MKKNIKTLYDILAESLKGRKIKARCYLNEGYHNYIHNEEHEVIGWNNEIEYYEWIGVVKDILINDNSHIDIVFDENLPIIKSQEDISNDCFNWHMRDFIEILE